MAGSIEKRDRILAGKATIEAVYNEGKDALYQWRRVGKVTEIPQVKAARLSSKAIDTVLTEDEKLIIPNRLRPVSAAFDFPDEPEYAPIRRALAAIDAAHDDGDLPPLPIELARDLDLDDDGEYWSDGLQALKIRVSARSKVKEFALACEAGHFLDHQALTLGQGFASLVPDGLLDKVLQAIRSSQSYSEWNRVVISTEALAYYNDPTEMWSRTYAQWIGQRSGSIRLKAQADQVIDGEYGYWRWDDFEPINQEIEKVFQKRGWL